MRFLQSMAAGLMTAMMVAFGMLMFLFRRGSPAMSHTPELAVPLLMAFGLGFGLGWWNLRPE
jgi:UDP-N-acetylmuramyl pentapeptide phosphotransferase/UDP-N-acetylglucosamine-1-phosphate transferase